MKYYVVKYTGAFGFIKQYSSVRDKESYSQRFLTPSIIEGIRRKLEVSKILRHKIYCRGLTYPVVECVTPKIIKKKKGKKSESILYRSSLIEPIVFLAFENIEDAQHANWQHICLCRNEDMLFPTGDILIIEEEQFDNLKELYEDELDKELLDIGWELIFEKTEESFFVGYNRYKNNEPMWGWLKIS